MTKTRIFTTILVAMICLAGLGLVANLAMNRSVTRTSADEYDNRHIDITASINGAGSTDATSVHYYTTGSIPELVLAQADTAKTITVAYSVAANTGINSLVSTLAYDTSVFSIASAEAVVISATPLGEATINNASFSKFTIENNTKFTTETFANLILVTFNVNPTSLTQDTTFNFGLTESAAYRIVTGDLQTGTQEAVKVNVTQAQLKIILINDFTVTLKDYANQATGLTATLQNLDIYEGTNVIDAGAHHAITNVDPAWDNSLDADADKGITYTYNGTWTDGTNTYYATISGDNKTISLYSNAAKTELAQFSNNTILIANYDETMREFTVSYYVCDEGATTGYTAEPVATRQVAYKSNIPVVVHTNTWFRVDSWFRDQAQQTAIATMANENINVYGAFAFDIGKGDVNGDRIIDANDITLYRQWIVGGYNIVVIESGTEYATLTGADYDENKVYFLVKVADVNADDSEDIRDVSTTRMAHVGGYAWEVQNNYNVTGQDIVRSILTEDYSTMVAGLNAGSSVSLYSDITSADSDLNIATTGNVYFDLCGKTLTVKSFSIVSTGRSTITIKNGTIITTDGITISAPNGNVILTDVTGYDTNGIVNLAAANHSLHVNGVVEFREGNKVASVPADINVADGTHLVIEEAAEIVVKKIVVTDEHFVVTPAIAESAIITLTNNSDNVTPGIQGIVDVTEGTNVSTAAELTAALATDATEIILTADITPGKNNEVAINRAITIYGNGHRLQAKLSGNGTIAFNNVKVTNTQTIANQFTGTFICNGGYLDSISTGTDDTDASFCSRSNPNASFEFRNMSITPSITKGIKISNAKSVLIDGCTFNVGYLTIAQPGANSDLQSLSLVDIQIYDTTGGNPNITITNSVFIDAPQGSTMVPGCVINSSEPGELANSDTGAAIKLKVEKGCQFGTVTITGNTFTNNYRDILVGTAPYANQLQMSATAASNGRSAEGLEYNIITTNWTIANNTTSLTESVVESRGVATLSYIGGSGSFNKYTTHVGNIGKLLGGCGIWAIGDSFDKIGDTWYYVENGVYYGVAVDNGRAILTQASVSTAAELTAALATDATEIILTADITPGKNNEVAINRAITIYGNGHRLQAKLSGNGTIAFNNVKVTNTQTIANQFTGTFICNGGYLDSISTGTDDTDASFCSRSNPNASFEFRNMSITASITKGIKISNAKSILIDGCTFDATKLSIVVNQINSDIQSLSLVDIQIYDTAGGNPDITITNSVFVGAPQGSTAVPTGTLADSDTGAAIKLKVEKGCQFGTVTITGNTFTNNYRDILVGTAPYANQLQMSATAASSGRSAEGLQYNKIDGWIISENTTTLTADVVASRGVATLSYIGGPGSFNKFTTSVSNVGQLTGGCGIWVIADAFEKIDGTWYYKKGGKYYSVAVQDYDVVLTEFTPNA